MLIPLCAIHKLLYLEIFSLCTKSVNRCIRFSGKSRRKVGIEDRGSRVKDPSLRGGVFLLFLFICLFFYPLNDENHVTLSSV